uniref:Uncharacterized protein n=1 Tax=Chenopodium quinoa TaxID=63459 RepID=A0A803N421_CHEQI
MEQREPLKLCLLCSELSDSPRISNVSSSMGKLKTDINGNLGDFTVKEGGASPVRLALLPHGSPSGLFFARNRVSSYK